MIVIGFAFLLSTLALILQSTLPLPITCLAYAPWIALISLRFAPPQSLYLATCGGIAADLLSSDPIGLHTLNYALTTLGLSSWRKYGTFQNPLHFSLFTYLASS